MIYNVVLASRVQKTDSIIHVHIYSFFFRFFPHIGYYKILSIVPLGSLTGYYSSLIGYNNPYRLLQNIEYSSQQ